MSQSSTLDPIGSRPRQEPRVPASRTTPPSLQLSLPPESSSSHFPPSPTTQLSSPSSTEYNVCHHDSLTEKVQGLHRLIPRLLQHAPSSLQLEVLKESFRWATEDEAVPITPNSSSSSSSESSSPGEEEKQCTSEDFNRPRDTEVQSTSSISSSSSPDTSSSLPFMSFDVDHTKSSSYSSSPPASPEDRETSHIMLGLIDEPIATKGDRANQTIKTLGRTPSASSLLPPITQEGSPENLEIEDQSNNEVDPSIHHRTPLSPESKGQLTSTLQSQADMSEGPNIHDSILEFSHEDDLLLAEPPSMFLRSGLSDPPDMSLTWEGILGFSGEGEDSGSTCTNVSSGFSSGKTIRPGSERGMWEEEEGLDAQVLMHLPEGADVSIMMDEDASLLGPGLDGVGGVQREERDHERLMRLPRILESHDERVEREVRGGTRPGIGMSVGSRIFSNSGKDRGGGHTLLKKAIRTASHRSGKESDEPRSGSYPSNLAIRTSHRSAKEMGEPKSGPHPSDMAIARSPDKSRAHEIFKPPREVQASPSDIALEKKRRVDAIIQARRMASAALSSKHQDIQGSYGSSSLSKVVSHRPPSSPSPPSLGSRRLDPNRDGTLLGSPLEPPRVLSPCSPTDHRRGSPPRSPITPLRSLPTRSLGEPSYVMVSTHSQYPIEAPKDRRDQPEGEGGTRGLVRVGSRIVQPGMSVLSRDTKPFLLDDPFRFSPCLRSGGRPAKRVSGEETLQREHHRPYEQDFEHPPPLPISHHGRYCQQPLPFLAIWY
ncbi:hypothetical protein BJ684DRAFT_14886 [Piptocephalis cylindrospora]|uniref:Uncharacterized protein n=1 Tax=Piptocephalis cylindrospora TaxID=1907219 RepID=A0A4P9Y6S4_9FUNG|nr:hypothetical protein BJ684DRAFT_14886 [Piptocephalis cylindrospora]|eukprot:RKP14816.1 hypothetical protein BJ684DRAFT_14886 [Piptocephalis cylindrospora]